MELLLIKGMFYNVKNKYCNDMEEYIKDTLRLFEMGLRNEEQAVTELLNLLNVNDTLIAWEQFKKANWYESESIDVEKMLIDKFQAIYGR